MAETTLLGVSKSVLQQLSSPAKEEFLLVWNSKKDLKRLEHTIQTITNFLHDAEQKESTNDLVKGWLSRLREVLYEADDLFDSVSFLALHKKTMEGNSIVKEVCLFFSKWSQLGFAFKTAHDVKAIRERLDGITNDMSQFSFTLIKPIEVEAKPVRLHNREETHSFVMVEDVIGRDREIDEIIKLLLPKDNRGEDQSSLSVISVIGFGGLGKTTLAQRVYNHERVQSSFDLCIWACINYLSDLKLVLVEILTSVLKKKPEDNNLDQLQQQLRENIRGKKYLLVLDDVWDEEASGWLKLKSLLSFGKNGSKVLVTTRSNEVAQCLDAVKPYYHLSVLSEESAWDLFVKMAFEEGELSNCDPGLVLLGKQIVHKCGCVPLALVTIGRMIRYRKKEINTWKSFVDKELPEVFLGRNVDKVKLMQVLKVSYNDLPPALKHCFAYCSLFPKDYRFNKDVLVRLWIAQGFIVQHGKKSLEEVGDDYFFHMVDRCFFQEVVMSSEYGCVTYTCKMHDLLHDLAVQVAGNECSYFAEKDMENLGEKNTAHRHISLHCNSNLLLDLSSMSSQSKALRTLLLFRFSFGEVGLRATCLDSFFTSFKVLRVLNLSWLKFEKLPNSIGELIHLRYLDLSWNRELIGLPNSICKLHHLQVLILEGCRVLKKLPTNLGKLMSLRHLILKYCRNLHTLPSGLAALTSLVTLDRITVDHDDGGLRYLGQLDNLCGLIKIKFPGKGWSNCIEDARKSNMSRKHTLYGMSINWEIYGGEGGMEKEEAKAVLEQLEPNENLQYLKIEGYEGDTLSNWVSSLSNLKELVLYNCSLEYLKDAKCSLEFPCLEVLKMEHLSVLKGWWRELGDNAPMSIQQLYICLPRVSSVVIGVCPNLVESMPLFSVEIKELRLSWVNEKLVRKLLSTPRTSCSSRTECQHYSKLQDLKLMDIKDLKCLPEDWVRHLTALKSLSITYCDELSWVSSCGLAYLTSLEELEIYNCGNVRFLEDKEDETVSAGMNNGLGMMPWKTLQRLCKLDVPWQSHLQEGLRYLTSLEQLRIKYYEADQVEADNEDMEGRGLLRKLGLLERLRSLFILFNGIRCRFSNWIQYLRSIKDLKFLECDELMSMSWGILANLKNLRTLYFYKVKKVSKISGDDWVAEQQTQFNSLVELTIEDAEEGEWIRDIPWNLFPSLRSLEFTRIGNLESLPDGIQHLTSLQQLSIDNCQEIEAIPNWMINLTSLQRLVIYKCSRKLVERCERETGVDWHLISRIPERNIIPAFQDYT